MAKKRFSRWQPPPSWILKILIFGHVTVIGLNIWCSVPNFIKIGRFLTEIWRFNDFQNGGRPPSWILKNYSFCHVALVDIPFCFLIQNFPEIGQSVDELWPKKRFSRWRICCDVTILHRGTHFRCPNTVLKFHVDRCCSFRDTCSSRPFGCT